MSRLHLQPFTLYNYHPYLSTRSTDADQSTISQGRYTGDQQQHQQREVREGTPPNGNGNNRFGKKMNHLSSYSGCSTGGGHHGRQSSGPQVRRGGGDELDVVLPDRVGLSYANTTLRRPQQVKPSTSTAVTSTASSAGITNNRVASRHHHHHTNGMQSHPSSPSSFLSSTTRRYTSSSNAHNPIIKSPVASSRVATPRIPSSFSSPEGTRRQVSFVDDCGDVDDSGNNGTVVGSSSSSSSSTSVSVGGSSRTRAGDTSTQKIIDKKDRMERDDSAAHMSTFSSSSASLSSSSYRRALISMATRMLLSHPRLDPNNNTTNTTHNIVCRFVDRVMHDEAPYDGACHSAAATTGRGNCDGDDNDKDDAFLNPGLLDVSFWPLSSSSSTFISSSSSSSSPSATSLLPKIRRLDAARLWQLVDSYVHQQENQRMRSYHDNSNNNISSSSLSVANTSAAEAKEEAEEERRRDDAFFEMQSGKVEQIRNNTSSVVGSNNRRKTGVERTSTATTKPPPHQRHFLILSRSGDDNNDDDDGRGGEKRRKGNRRRSLHFYASTNAPLMNDVASSSVFSSFSSPAASTTTACSKKAHRTLKWHLVEGSVGKEEWLQRDSLFKMNTSKKYQKNKKTKTNKEEIMVIDTMNKTTKGGRTRGDHTPIQYSVDAYPDFSRRSAVEYADQDKDIDESVASYAYCLGRDRNLFLDKDDKSVGHDLDSTLTSSTTTTTPTPLFRELPSIDTLVHTGLVRITPLLNSLADTTEPSTEEELDDSKNTRSSLIQFEIVCDSSGDDDSSSSRSSNRRTVNRTSAGGKGKGYLKPGVMYTLIAEIVAADGDGEGVGVDVVHHHADADLPSSPTLVDTAQFMLPS